MFLINQYLIPRITSRTIRQPVSCLAESSRRSIMFFPNFQLITLIFTMQIGKVLFLAISPACLFALKLFAVCQVIRSKPSPCRSLFYTAPPASVGSTVISIRALEAVTSRMAA